MRPIQRISGQKRVCRRGVNPRGGCLRAANCGDGQRWREANGERRVANDKQRLTEDGQRVAGSGGRTVGTGNKQRAADGGRRAANGGQRTAGSGGRTVGTDNKRQTTGSKQRAADGGQQTANSRRRTAGKRRPVTGGALRTFCRAAKDAATGLRKLPNLTYLCTMRRKNERYNEPVVRGVVAQLRELRHARNLSQKQVFTDTDINIGRIESGRGNISVSTLADLCAYYGIPLREFFERLEAGIASGE